MPSDPNDANAAIEIKLDAAAARTEEINGSFGFLVENVIEMKRVHLQVISLGKGDDGSSDDDKSNDDKGMRFLLGTTEAGLRVDVELLGVDASNGKGNPISFQAVTAVGISAGTGKLDVEVTLPKKLKNAKIFEFRVEHGHGTLKHFGTIVVDIRDSKNLGAGQ